MYFPPGFDPKVDDPPAVGKSCVRLDLQQRHEDERALQHAGLNTEGGLEFSLRDQNS
jgi:hypothetical protein